MPINRIKSSVSNFKESIAKPTLANNLKTYIHDLQKHGSIDPDDASKALTSLNQHAEDLLPLAGRMFVIEKIMDIGAWPIAASAVASGGTVLPTIAAIEGTKIAVMNGMVAADKKFKGNKVPLHGFASLPWLGSLAPITTLYKDHRELFRVVRSYAFNRENFSIYQISEPRITALGGRIESQWNKSPVINIQDWTSKKTQEVLPADWKPGKSQKQKPTTNTISFQSNKPKDKPTQFTEHTSFNQAISFQQAA